MTESTATMLAPAELAFLRWLMASSPTATVCRIRSGLLQPDCVGGDDCCVGSDVDPFDDLVASILRRPLWTRGGRGSTLLAVRTGLDRHGGRVMQVVSHRV